MTEATRKTRFKPGWEWPFAIVVFFVLLTVINAWVIYTGYTSAGSLVEDGAYEKGLDYQQTIDRLALVGKLGWQVDFILSSEAEQQLGSVVLRDDQGRALQGAEVVLRAIRPADAAADFSLRLVEAAAGRYQAALPLRGSGLWYFEISIKSGPNEGLLKFQRMIAS